MTVSSPFEVPEAHAIIRNLCALHAHVVSEILGYDSPSDCFCGDSGFWPLNSQDDFRNDGESLKFIEDAVLKAIAERKVKACGPENVGYGNCPNGRDSCNGTWCVPVRTTAMAMEALRLIAYGFDGDEFQDSSDVVDQHREIARSALAIVEAKP